jgi:glutathione S-transferase
MATLYYTTSSCGAASFSAAVTAGLHLKADQVAFATHTTNSGADFYQINPKGNVPCIVLEDGTVLNEGAATLQYIADQVHIYMIYIHNDLLGLLTCTSMLCSSCSTVFN